MVSQGTASHLSPPCEREELMAGHLIPWLSSGAELLSDADGDRAGAQGSLQPSVACGCSTGSGSRK